MKYHLEIFFIFFVFNRSYVAHLLVPQLLLVYQLFTENSAAFVLLIGLELKAAKEVFIIIAIYLLLYLFNVKRCTWWSTTWEKAFTFPPALISLYFSEQLFNCSSCAIWQTKVLCFNSIVALIVEIVGWAVWLSPFTVSVVPFFILK